MNQWMHWLTKHKQIMPHSDALHNMATLFNNHPYTISFMETCFCSFWYCNTWSHYCVGSNILDQNSLYSMVAHCLSLVHIFFAYSCIATCVFHMHFRSQRNASKKMWTWLYSRIAKDQKSQWYTYKVNLVRITSLTPTRAKSCDFRRSFMFFLLKNHGVCVSNSTSSSQEQHVTSTVLHDIIIIVD